MAEAEIMEELDGLGSELQSFPAQAHWFCPRRQNDDMIDYDHPDEAEEEMTSETKYEMIEASKKRHQVAYKYSLIFGLSPDVSGTLLTEYTQKLNHLLMSCDKCVHNWHMGRKAYLKELAEQFDDDTVQELSDRLNLIDFQRLDRGLEIAQNILAGAEPQQRTQSLLAAQDSTALLSLYEALCTVDYLKSPERLSKYFNYVFEQVQTRKILRIADTLPAMVRFLFDDDIIRLRFARLAWEKMPSEQVLTAPIFEWVVHSALSEAIFQVAQPSAHYDHIKRFWEAFLLLLDKMDEDLITHSLRGMEIQPDIYHLALQHLACNSEEILQLVIETLRALLKKSPKSFWAALGTISLATVAEQIFQSPTFENLLSKITLGDPQSSYILSWAPEFVQSLPSVHQYDGCRSLLYHLLERLQDRRFPENARLACCHAGLDALRATLVAFVKSDYVINPSTSLIVIGDILGLVDKYKEMIVGCADLQNDDPNHLGLKKLGMVVIRDALALDCKALSAEFFALDKDTPIQRGTTNHSESIWSAVLDVFRPGNVDLAKSILAAMSPLTGLDKLRPVDKKKPQHLPKSHAQFNQDLHKFSGNVSRVFERLSDFKSSELWQLTEDSHAVRPFFGSLLSSDQETYEAAVEVMKAMTGHISKQEAFSDLLEKSFSPMLNSFTYAVTRIIKTRTFGPTPYMIKIGRDVLKALTGNTGHLRNHSSLGNVDQNALMAWWLYQWRALDMVFSTTERWTARVDYPTNFFQDFCRDGMEYAEELFDQYEIIASALREQTPTDEEKPSRSGSSKASMRKVLQVVCNHVNGLTMMIRLRDSYLIEVITSLLGKLLRCLTQFDMEIDEFASTYIMDACKRENEPGFRRTNLTRQQKAELQEALFQHQGVEILEAPPPVAKKQATIDAWSRSGDGKTHESIAGIDNKGVAFLDNYFKSSEDKKSSGKSSSSSSAKSSAGMSNLDAWSKSASSRKHEPKSAVKNHTGGNLIDQQSILDQMRAQQAKNQQQSEAFHEKRRKDAEEKKLRDAKAIAAAKALRFPSLVQGEGSGMKGLGGVAGKDHAPIRSEIMVSSDSESDDDLDEDETNALVTERKASKRVKEIEESRKRAMMRQPSGPVVKVKTARTKKDLRARLQPNMDILYDEILRWDIFHQGDEPPSNNVCRKIADKFSNELSYTDTFKPLLIAEVWRNLVTAKDEGNYKPVEIKVLNRLTVDQFYEVSTQMPIVNNRDLNMFERDIVLLSRSSDPLSNEQEPHCLAVVHRNTRKKDVIEVVYRISKSVNPDMLQCFLPNLKVNAIKIADMTTTLREFAALSGLEFYDLSTEILQAKPSPIQKYSDEKISLLSRKYTLNPGQAKAILSANDNDGFTLIQGPPGSGKTKTIVAMVGALLSPVLQEQAQRVGTRPQGQNGSAGPPPPKKKLLICAPSNAAVDELVVRLKQGIVPLHGPRQKINIIRLGRSDAINASVLDVTLEELLQAKLNGDKAANQGQPTDRDKLHKDAGLIKERLNVLRPQLEEARAKNDDLLKQKLQREFDELKRKQVHIGNKIDEDKESGNTVQRQNQISKQKYTAELLNEAHVVCATLSGSGHEMFGKIDGLEFETVIIDEAAQCIELSALIPLKYGCTKCILVGDPEQLPPTVLSRQAQSFGYEQSLFVRMQRNHPSDVHLLDTQYRMHPEISKFPSKTFYHGRLIDGPGMAQLRVQPWHVSSVLGPYRFFDIAGAQTREQKGHSFINIPELNAAIRLYERLKADYGRHDFTGKIGIIATYKAQLNELKARFARKFGDAIFDEIEFNTTDAFQGREREIIIFSCVRAKATGGIGFLQDIRRMNVGLTRAKSSLWVLGDSKALQQGEFWNKLIEDAKVRDRYTGGDVMTLLSRPTTNDAEIAEAAQAAKDNAEKGAQPHPASKTIAPLTQVVDEEVEMTDVTESEKKRKRDPTDDEDGQSAKKIKSEYPFVVDPPQNEVPRPRPADKSVDLSALLEAKTATKFTSKPGPATPAAPQQPGAPKGVAPPRRKAPADPFIRKKPPARR